MKNICSLLLLFLGLCLSALAGAQADATLLVTTDMDCNWKLDEQPMGLLKAGDSKVVPLSPGEHRIRAATTDGVAIIHTKVQADQDQTTVEIQLASQHEQQLKLNHDKPAGESEQADAAATWTDRATGLMWTKTDSGSDLDWNQAKDYCSNLHLAGYKDWHLPTIEELQGIYDPSVSSRQVLAMGTTNVHVKGNLKITGDWEWSSSHGYASAAPWHIAWVIAFGWTEEQEPRRFFLVRFNHHTRALCVRDSGE